MELEFPGSENDSSGFQYMNVQRNIGKTGGIEDNSLYRTVPCTAGHLAAVTPPPAPLPRKQKHSTSFLNTSGGRWYYPFENHWVR